MYTTRVCELYIHIHILYTKLLKKFGISQLYTLILLQLYKQNINETYNTKAYIFLYPLATQMEKNKSLLRSKKVQLLSG